MTQDLVEREPRDVAAYTPTSEDAHMRLIELAVSRDLDVVKLEKLMDLQERHDRTLARKAFYEAMARFQSEVPTIKKLRPLILAPPAPARRALNTNTPHWMILAKRSSHSCKSTV